jgi:hypothetical protein
LLLMLVYSEVAAPSPTEQPSRIGPLEVPTSRFSKKRISKRF